MRSWLVVGEVCPKIVEEGLYSASVFTSSVTMTVKFEREKGFIRVTPQGELSCNGIMREFEQVISHPEYSPGLPRLWDLRASSGAKLTFDDMRKLAQFVTRREAACGPSKVALVTERDLDFGLSRMYEMLSASRTPVYSVRVFRGTADAVAWLVATRKNLHEED